MVEAQGPTIREIARDLRSGRTTAGELAEAAFARVDALDSSLCAFVSVTRERAMREARAADKRLARDRDAPLLCGIPYAAKDILDVAGEVTQGGCPMLSENCATVDSNAVEILARHGMVLIGKTRTSPLACEITGLNHSETSPRNPWKAEPHIPGGSSSGSAVAVAAGLVPVALGSDTGGSVRAPAALSGVTGHKTTLGEVGRGGVLPLADSLDTVGTLAGSVDDAAFIFDAMRGADPRDRTTLSSRPSHPPPKALSDCRIIVAEGALFDDVAPEIVQSVLDLGLLLEDLGATVERREVPIFAEVRSLSERDDLISGEAWRNSREILERWGQDRDSLTDWIFEGAEVDDDRLAACRELQARKQAEFVNYAQGIDAFIGPTVRATARPIAAVDADFGTHAANYVRNTIIGNFLNLCAVSIPTGLDRDGLPMSAMILGSPFTDRQVLAIAAALQASGQLADIAPDLAWAGG